MKDPLQCQAIIAEAIELGVAEDAKYFFGDLDVQALTRELVYKLLYDLELTAVQKAAFGITSGKHYLALSMAMFGYAQYDRSVDEIIEDGPDAGLKSRVKQLDQVVGNGKKLTAFVKKYAPRYRWLTFQTPYDDLAKTSKESVSW
jgi:hypothetical protein